MMKPGVLPDSGNHINFAPTLAVDGGGTTFSNLDFMIFILFVDLFCDKNYRIPKEERILPLRIRIVNWSEEILFLTILLQN